MATNHDFIPKKDAEFGPWAHNLITYAKANATRLGIPNLEFAALDAYYASWNEDFEKCQSPNHTSADVAKKKDDHGVLETGIRAFVNQFIRYNPAVTHADLTSMGLPIRDTSHTPKPKPGDLVDFDISVVPSDHRVVAKFHIAGSTSRGKGSYHAAEIRYWVRPLTEPGPLDANEEGWHSVADTKSPWEKSFPGADAGKRLYLVMRWENNATGEGDAGKGQWGEMLNVVIP
jgi:hypothetical protein